MVDIGELKGSGIVKSFLEIDEAEDNIKRDLACIGALRLVSTAMRVKKNNFFLFFYKCKGIILPSRLNLGR